MLCEICENDNWEQLKGDWARCNVCGRLETILKTKACSGCGEDLGKYSKKTQKLCLKCMSKRWGGECDIPCITKGCCNRLGIKRDPSMMCRQCIVEDDRNKGSHLWKSYAIKILTEETGKKNLFKIISKQFKSVTEATVENWLHKNKKKGIVESHKFGMYIAAETSVVEPNISQKVYLAPKLIR